ncbi:MAG: hypothetical protein BWZ10_00587 [candidate division BRC1 bacterium ADurb.BinA364]|nr:MAG: hypothetical protein BWZ10_00587 [candidate division BRC1 bacterium ADurb.BinA364]
MLGQKLFQRRQSIDGFGQGDDESQPRLFVRQFEVLGHGIFAAEKLSVLYHHRNRPRFAAGGGERLVARGFGAERAAPGGLEIDGVGQYHFGVDGQNAWRQQALDFVFRVARRPIVDRRARRFELRRVIQFRRAAAEDIFDRRDISRDQAQPLLGPERVGRLHIAFGGAFQDVDFVDQGLDRRPQRIRIEGEAQRAIELGQGLLARTGIQHRQRGGDAVGGEEHIAGRPAQLPVHVESELVVGFDDGGQIDLSAGFPGGLRDLVLAPNACPRRQRGAQRPCRECPPPNSHQEPLLSSGQAVERPSLAFDSSAISQKTGAIGKALFCEQTREDRQNSRSVGMPMARSDPWRPDAVPTGRRHALRQRQIKAEAPGGRFRTCSMSRRTAPRQAPAARQDSGIFSSGSRRDWRGGRRP